MIMLSLSRHTLLFTTAFVILSLAIVQCQEATTTVGVATAVTNSENVVIFNLEGTGSITIACPSTDDSCSPNGAIGGIVGEFTSTGNQLQPLQADARATVSEAASGGATTVTCSNSACTCHLMDFTPCQTIETTTMANSPAIGGNGGGAESVFENGGTEIAPGAEDIFAAMAEGDEDSENVDDGWQGCIHPTNPNADDFVQIGVRTTICLVLANGADWQRGNVYIRLSFRPHADEYSRLRIPNSYRDLVTESSAVSGENTNITLHVASQKVLSFQKMYQTPMGNVGKVFPYTTAIIDVREGIVQGIVWDDGCMFCDSRQCEENTYDFKGQMGTREEFQQDTRACWISEEQCNRYMAEGTNNCDILLYVVWTGTDRYGKAFQSYETRFSAFEARELQERFLDGIPDIPGNLFGSD